MDVLYPILYAIAVISGMGLIFGIGLGIAGKIFEVKEDPTTNEIKNALPGANCGGCGFPGCEGFAVAVANGQAKPDGCPVGGAKTALAVAAIMGIEITVDDTRKVAFVKCTGGQSKSDFRYDYMGMDHCLAVSKLTGGGPKKCNYGCLGNGTCVKACVFNAITIVDGIAVVDPEKCTQCGMCVDACPRNIIELVPFDSKIRVACSTKDKGKDVRSICAVGCIGCKLCEKTCEDGAIAVDGNLAKIDYHKCTQCGKCVEKCPTKAIVM